MVLLDLGSGLVTPSWLPLVLVIVLLGVVGFLYWSMRRNLNRIDFDDGSSPQPPSSPPAE